MINWPLTHMPYLVFPPSLVALAVIFPPVTRNVPFIPIRIPDALPSSTPPSDCDALALIVPLSIVKSPIRLIPDPAFLPYTFKAPSPLIVTVVPSPIQRALVLLFEAVASNVLSPSNLIIQFE